MDIKAFPALIVGVVVALVLAGAVLPVFAETTSATDTFKNTGYFTVDKYTSDDSVIVSWDHTKPDIITVGDTEITVNSPLNKWVSLVVGDNWYFRYVHTDTQTEIQMSYGGVGTIGASTQNAKDFILECENGTATGTSYLSGEVSTTQTVAYTEIYVISENGQYYIMKDSDVTATMLKDSEFVGVGQTFISGGACIIRIEGSINDGATVTVIGSTSPATIDTDTIKINATPKNGYIDCYDLNSITFDINTSGGTTHATYNYFIVPSEVTAEKAIHPDGPLTVILNVLPLLAIAGLVTGAVVWFINRKG